MVQTSGKLEPEDNNAQGNNGNGFLRNISSSISRAFDYARGSANSKKAHLIETGPDLFNSSNSGIYQPKEYSESNLSVTRVSPNESPAMRSYRNNNHSTVDSSILQGATSIVEAYRSALKSQFQAVSRKKDADVHRNAPPQKIPRVSASVSEPKPLTSSRAESQSESESVSQGSSFRKDPKFARTSYLSFASQKRSGQKAAFNRFQKRRHFVPVKPAIQVYRLPLVDIKKLPDDRKKNPGFITAAFEVSDDEDEPKEPVIKEGTLKRRPLVESSHLNGKKSKPSETPIFKFSDNKSDEISGSQSQAFKPSFGKVSQEKDSKGSTSLFSNIGGDTKDTKDTKESTDSKESKESKESQQADVGKVNANTGTNTDSSSNKDKPAPLFQFGSTQKSDSKSTDSSSTDSKPLSFGFGSNVAKSETTEASEAKKPLFSFGKVESEKPATTEENKSKGAEKPVSFSFGSSLPTKDVSGEKSSSTSLNFGASQSDASDKKDAPKPLFSFGAPSSTPAVKPSNDESASKPLFSFGASTTTNPPKKSDEAKEEKSSEKPVFLFGSNNSSTSEGSKTASESKPLVSFGTAATSTNDQEKAKEPEKPTLSFGFGTAPAASSTETKKPLFGVDSGSTQPAKEKPLFGGSLLPASTSATSSTPAASNSSEKPNLFGSAAPVSGTAATTVSSVPQVSAIFGAPKPAAAAAPATDDSKKTNTLFGSAPSDGAFKPAASLPFNTNNDTQKPDVAKPAAPSFTFGSAASASIPFSFGSNTAASTPFTFGANTTANTAPAGSQSSTGFNKAPETTGFGFGAPVTAPNSGTASPQPQLGFGATVNPFKPGIQQQPPKPAFGAQPVSAFGAPAGAPAPAPAFSFGAAGNTGTSGFGFNQQASASFPASAPAAAPVSSTGSFQNSREGTPSATTTVPNRVIAQARKRLSRK